jgi:arsenate reductase
MSLQGPETDRDRQRVLFLCTHNSVRSQMAEGLLRTLGGDRFEVHSAGTVASGVNPEAIRAMAELGIDIQHQESKALERYRTQHFNWVITVCDDAAEACPRFPGNVRRLHWSLPDPGRAPGDERQRFVVFREVRDRLRKLVEEFIADHRSPSD